MSRIEIYSRTEIVLDEYCKEISIEALTYIDMVKKEIIPAVASYIKELSDTACSKRLFIANAECETESKLVDKLSLLMRSLYNKTELLENKLIGVKNFESSVEIADYSSSHIFETMQELRAVIDELETNTSKKYWPFPTYGELLFSV